jgi:hypothetical protein
MGKVKAMSYDKLCVFTQNSLHDNVPDAILRKYGVSVYDAANVLARASRSMLLHRLRRA